MYLVKMNSDERRRIMYRMEQLNKMMGNNKNNENNEYRYNSIPNTNPVRKRPQKCVGGSSYTSAEDRKLEEAVEKFGYQWALISKTKFQGTRSGDSLRNRYNILQKKQKEQSYRFNSRSSKSEPQMKSIKKQPNQQKKATNSIKVQRPKEIRKPTPPVESSNKQKQIPFVKNGRKVFVYKMDENDKKKKYRVYQGPRGGFLFKRGGNDVKLNHTNGFVFEK